MQEVHVTHVSLLEVVHSLLGLRQQSLQLNSSFPQQLVLFDGLAEGLPQLGRLVLDLHPPRRGLEACAGQHGLICGFQLHLLIGCFQMDGLELVTGPRILAHVFETVSGLPSILLCDLVPSVLLFLLPVVATAAGVRSEHVL